MFAHLKELIPGAEQWPTFGKNKSESFEARFSIVEIQNYRLTVRGLQVFPLLIRNKSL